jgi:hypothetical protein
MENENNMMNMGGQKKNMSIGPVIGLIIILALILVGGIYFWGARTNTQSYNQTQTPTANEAAAVKNGSSSETQYSDDTDSLETASTQIEAQFKNEDSLSDIK